MEVPERPDGPAGTPAAPASPAPAEAPPAVQGEPGTSAAAPARPDEYEPDAPGDVAGVADVADGAQVPVAPAGPVAPVRRRGRTALLIAASAVLGLIAGTCAGYLVQADREPTALPPLSQPAMGQAKGKGPAPLSAAQDRMVKTEGDLRRLLLKKPAGARAGTSARNRDGWLDIREYAGEFVNAGRGFDALVGLEFRRAAVTGWWDRGDYNVDIRLVQFRQTDTTSAADSAHDHQIWAEDEPDTDSWPVPGTGEGMAYVHNRPNTKPGYLPLYAAQAHARRGNVAMEIWIFGTKPVPKKMIMNLAERQMERL